MPDEGNNAPPTQGMQPPKRTSQMPATREALSQEAFIKKGALSQGSVPLRPIVTAASRQVKLTIGRLDVQVNNHLPALSPSRAISTAIPTATDALEQHFLDRFRLKI